MKINQENFTVGDFGCFHRVANKYTLLLLLACAIPKCTSCNIVSMLVCSLAGEINVFHPFFRCVPIILFFGAVTQQFVCTRHQSVLAHKLKLFFSCYYRRHRCCCCRFFLFYKWFTIRKVSKTATLTNKLPSKWLHTPYSYTYSRIKMINDQLEIAHSIPFVKYCSIFNHEDITDVFCKTFPPEKKTRGW